MALLFYTCYYIPLKHISSNRVLIIMPSNSSNSQGNGYFNDLSRQPSHHSSRSDSPPDPAGATGEIGIPRPKRIACIICRKRKLKCDGGKPSCGTCKRLGHKCAYDEVRRKSGPKRGYVKELEARLGTSSFMISTRTLSQPKLTLGYQLSSASGDTAQVQRKRKVCDHFADSVFCDPWATYDTSVRLSAG